MAATNVTSHGRPIRCPERLTPAPRKNSSSSPPEAGGAGDVSDGDEPSELAEPSVSPSLSPPSSSSPSSDEPEPDESVGRAEFVDWVTDCELVELSAGVVVTELSVSEDCDCAADEEAASSPLEVVGLVSEEDELVLVVVSVDLDELVREVLDVVVDELVSPAELVGPESRSSQKSKNCANSGKSSPLVSPSSPNASAQSKQFCSASMNAEPARHSRLVLPSDSASNIALLQSS